MSEYVQQVVCYNPCSQLAGLYNVKHNEINQWLPIRQRIHSKLALLSTNLDTLCYRHAYRSSRTIIQPGNFSHRLLHLFSYQQLLPRSHHEPSLCLSQLYGTHSNLTCILLTLLAHFNLSLRAHCSLQLMAAQNSTDQSHPALTDSSLSPT